MIFPITRLNELYKDNLPFKGIFSVYGDFGVGKTTFSLQTLLNTIKLGNDVIFIYTKKNFPIKRLYELINEDTLNDLDTILNNILTIQILNFEDLRQLSFNLDFLIIEYQKKKVKLPSIIVIDSITDLYRINIDNEKKEKNIELNFQLNQILANLLYLNQKYSIEILIINNISRSSKDDENFEIQSGGKVMDYWISNSLKISRTERPDQRNFKLTKNQEKKKYYFFANITKKGFE
ncbi:MAG: hypothetical protein ACFFBP_10855 [Promethearchaeota archaeon]